MRRRDVGPGVGGIGPSAAAQAGRGGIWLVASMALGRPVGAGETLPHTCGSIVISPRGREIKLWRRDCPACSVEQAQERRQLEVTDDMLAEQRRRMGDNRICLSGSKSTPTSTTTPRRSV